MHETHRWMKKWFETRKGYQKQIERLNAQLLEAQIRLQESRHQLDRVLSQHQPPYDVDVNAGGSFSYEHPNPNESSYSPAQVGYGSRYNIRVTPLSWYDEPIQPPKHNLNAKRKIRVENK
jgi:hypothetical protein